MHGTQSLPRRPWSSEAPPESPLPECASRWSHEVSSADRLSYRSLLARHVTSAHALRQVHPKIDTRLPNLLRNARINTGCLPLGHVILPELYLDPSLTTLKPERSTTCHQFLQYTVYISGDNGNLVNDRHSQSRSMVFCNQSLDVMCECASHCPL